MREDSEQSVDEIRAEWNKEDVKQIDEDIQRTRCQ